MSMSLHDLLEALPGASAATLPDVEIMGITSDSRAVEPGWLFVAIRGTQADGHQYVQDAIQRGAAAVVVQENAAEAGVPVARAAAVIDTFRSRFGRLRVVGTGTGVGINVGRNAGVRAALGDLILICDADDVVQPGWMAAHAATLEHDDISGGPLDEEALNTGPVASFNAGRPQSGCPVSGRFLPYAAGGNLGFRRTVWEALGGFDDAWQRGATEIESCWRAQIAGFTVGWAPAAVVAYRHGPSVWREVRRRYRAARAGARLYSQFRAHGMPARRLGSALRAWCRIGFRAPWALARRRWRTKWLQVAAWRAGLAAGSIRYRVVYP